MFRLFLQKMEILMWGNSCNPRSGKFRWRFCLHLFWTFCQVNRVWWQKLTFPSLKVFVSFFNIEISQIPDQRKGLGENVLCYFHPHKQFTLFSVLFSVRIQWLCKKFLDKSFILEMLLRRSVVVPWLYSASWIWSSFGSSWLLKRERIRCGWSSDAW